MALVPTIRVWTSGEIVLASYMTNNINGPLAFLLSPPIFRGRQTVAQNLTTGVSAMITFDAEDVDSAGGHSTVANTSRYVGQYAGWYTDGGGASYAANATGIRGTSQFVNGSVVNGSGVAGPPASAGVTSVPSRSYMVFLNVNDYLEYSAIQTSGGNLLTSVATDHQSSMAVNFVSN